jgi:hypothetical protein
MMVLFHVTEDDDVVDAFLIDDRRLSIGRRFGWGWRRVQRGDLDDGRGRAGRFRLLV